MFSCTRFMRLALVLPVLLLFHCRAPGQATGTGRDAPIEQAVRLIPLTGPMSDSLAEVSGLAWYGEYLVALPQYPAFPGRGGGGRIFAIPKSAILAYLDNTVAGMPEPLAIDFDAPDMRRHIDGFEGYEAIVFDGDRAYLSIEAEPDTGPARSYLVRATMAADLSVLKVDTTGMPPVFSHSGVENMAEEALVLAGQKLISIHEANGSSVNDRPAAHLFDLQLQPLGTIPLAQIPYRITDATAVDEANRFWVINYYYPGETGLSQSTDLLAERYREGATHAESDYVERLLELQYTEEGVVLAGTPPVQLQLLRGVSRNWEGMVRLDHRGFLLITDQFPGTLLGFVYRPPTP